MVALCCIAVLYCYVMRIKTSIFVYILFVAFAVGAFAMSSEASASIDPWSPINPAHTVTPAYDFLLNEGQVNAPFVIKTNTDGVEYWEATEEGGNNGLTILEKGK